jgi:hypothetical protein
LLCAGVDGGPEITAGVGSLGSWDVTEVLGDVTMRW